GATRRPPWRDESAWPLLPGSPLRAGEGTGVGSRRARSLRGERAMSVDVAGAVVRGAVRRRTYRDSIELMGLAARIEQLAGVRLAAVLMGTPANREMVVAAGLAFEALADARPDDLVAAVAAEDASTAHAAL